jgi:hypothetical protein
VDHTLRPECCFEQSHQFEDGCCVSVLVVQLLAVPKQLSKLCRLSFFDQKIGLKTLHCCHGLLVLFWVLVNLLAVVKVKQILALFMS